MHRHNPFQKPLLVLPFDHRNSFARDLLKYSGTLSDKQKQAVRSLKKVVFDAFSLAIKGEAHPEWFGVFIDEEYGAELLVKAKRLGVTVSLATEKSGQPEYEFEYGADFLKHIQKFEPEFAKVLVRYNPAQKQINQRQLARIKRLSQACKKHGYSLLFELLVPATEADLKKAGSKANYDKQLRPQLTARAIKEIKSKVHVDLWKLEGMSCEGWKKVLAAIGPGPRVIVLGRGEGRAQVRKWLTDAARFDQLVGFAVGRTIFAKPLEDYLSKKFTRTQAVLRIAEDFKTYVRLWKKVKGL